MSSRPDKTLIWLGKYLSLALALPGCVFGGYVLGALVDNWLHIPALRAVGIILGMIAGLIQIFRELARDDGKENPRP